MTIDKNHLPPELAAQILEREAELSRAPLPDDVRELVTMLAEECAEVGQRCTKILRFGLTVNPWTGKHNRDQLELELGDLAAMVWLLDALGVVDGRRVDINRRAKIQALKRQDGRTRYVKIPEDM